MSQIIENSNIIMSQVIVDSNNEPGYCKQW